MKPFAKSALSSKLYSWDPIPNGQAEQSLKELLAKAKFKKLNTNILSSLHLRISIHNFAVLIALDKIAPFGYGYGCADGKCTFKTLLVLDLNIVVQCDHF